MRILLINHPGVNSNLGCQASLDGLVRCLRAGGADHIDILPDKLVRDIMFPAQVKAVSSIIRYWKPRNPSDTNDSIIKKGVSIAKKQSSHIDRLIVERWQENVRRILTRERSLVDIIRRSDRVVINGGGTLHHDRPAALSLFAIARAAQINGKEVHVVNSTIQAMHPEILKAVLIEAGRVAVREKRTLEYLKGLGIAAELSSDSICAADFHKEPGEFLLPERIDKENACLITSGVISVRQRIMPIVKTLRDAGYLPFYFMACRDDELNNWLISSLRSANVPIVQHGVIPWQDMLHYLKKIRLVVSGRYHINIMSRMAGVPFVPLASNTWKMEGARELYGWPVPVLAGESGLNDALSSLIVNR